MWQRLSCNRVHMLACSRSNVTRASARAYAGLYMMLTLLLICARLCRSMRVHADHCVYL